VAIGGPGEHEDIVLTLRSGTTIRGSVHGLPAAEQSNVFIMAHGDGYYDSTSTDDAGAFAFPHVPAGAVAIEATTSFRQGMSAATRIDVPEDGPPTIDVLVDFNGQSTLSGAVTRAGRPAPSVVLSAAPLDPTLTTRGRGESENDGRYRIDGLSNGQYQLVAIGAFGTYRRIVDVQGWTEYDIDLPAGSITGIVSDIRSHEAVADAVVTAATGKERSLAEAKRAVTDATGFYALTDLDPGTYQMRTTRSGYRQEVQIVDVQQTGQHRDVELQRHSDITLHIFDSTTGAPVSQASVRATAGGMFAFAEELSLDNAGRTEMPDLAPGDYLLTVLVAGYAPRSFPIHIPAATLEVPLEAGGRVQLRLRATASTRVRLLDTAGIAQAVPGSNPAGWTAIAGPSSLWPNIASGSYRLESMTGGVTPVVVKSGATSMVEVK